MPPVWLQGKSWVPLLQSPAAAAGKDVVFSQYPHSGTNATNHVQVGRFLREADLLGNGGNQGSRRVFFGAATLTKTAP